MPGPSSRNCSGSGGRGYCYSGPPTWPHRGGETLYPALGGGAIGWALGGIGEGCPTCGGGGYCADGVYSGVPSAGGDTSPCTGTNDPSRLPLACPAVEYPL